MRRAFLLLTVTWVCSLQAEEPPRSPQPTPAKSAEGELRRRAMFGAQLAPVTKDVRDRQKLDSDHGVVLERIFPGTSAADAEFKAGDVVLAIGENELTGVPKFLERVAKARAGDVLAFEVVRDGIKSHKRVTLREMPRESGDGYDVIYGSVASYGARLRTVVTRPKTEGRHPAVMLLQGGHTCFPIDTPVGQATSFTWIASYLTRHGYVTLRVERPGCGDSEGGPLRDVDFDTELDGYKQALRALKKFDFVDADNVFLFGHSMGGMMAPLIAVETPVRGIAFYGTGAGTWFEAVFGQRRRLASLDGTKPAEVDREILRQARFWYPLVVEKKTPREILERDPELKHLGWVTDDKYVGDRHYKFHHQLADKNLSEAWTKVAATRLLVGEEAASPRVLAIWGSSDWLVDRASNEWIAQIVNRVKPGNGTFVALDSIDHFFFRAATPEKSYQIWKPAKGTPPGELNPVILEKLGVWLDEAAGKTKRAPDRPKPVVDRLAGMDPYIRAAMEKWEVPGLAIAVIKDGETVLARGYGVRELGKDQKVNHDTIFPIASCTKSFTAASLAMLVDEKKLAWDDPVAKHLPTFELADPYLTKHVTVRDLLCHRIGLPWAELLSGDGRDVLRRTKYIEPIADFRTKFTYSNAMYAVAGEVVASVSGQPWDQFVVKRIFQPLNMSSTSVSAPDSDNERLARRHWNSDEGVVARPYARELPSAAGSIHSTVVDLARWVKLHLADGQIDGHRLLSEKTIGEMQALQFSIPVSNRPRNIYAARFHGAGLGWQVLDYRGRKVIRHGGGWGAWVALIPEERLGVVILSNLDLNGLSGMLMYDLFDAYLAGPEVAWDRAKWKTWLDIEGPGYAYRPRDEAKAHLEKARTAGTRPSLPLEKYAGAFDSKLYGRLVVRHDGGSLSATFGGFTTDLSHWQDESFYVRAPTRLTFDWLLTFGRSGDGQVASVTVKHVGWDKDEKDHLFVRGQ